MAKRKKRAGAFRPLTPAQSRVYHALRLLGEIIVTPNDARPLKALQRRGLVRYKRDDTGGRVAVLKETKAQRAVKARGKRATNWFGWPK
jgi:DNA-binding MarR family transcriptional regulator